MALADLTYKANLDRKFEDTIRYFKERGEVVFVNETYHFWEGHGFVQQSLAKLLTENGIPVTWYDYFGWRNYKPVLRWNSPNLKVTKKFRFPGDRLRIVRKINDEWTIHELNKKLESKGKKPVLWVHGSLSESIAAGLPWIDVFSVFDDPYRHSQGDPLLEKSTLITCQNKYAFDMLHKSYEDKTKLLLPPFELDPENYFQEGEFKLPEGFPGKVMGYIGSFTSDATDFGLVEYLLRNAPDWGVLFAGRTDVIGEYYMEKLKRYPNFIHVGWRPPNELTALWRNVHVTILPYKQARINDGAFPVKVLESFAYDIPVVATSVHKTSSLEGYIRRELFPDAFLIAVEEEYQKGYRRSGDVYRHFADKMNPKNHLIQVSDYLKSHSSF